MEQNENVMCFVFYRTYFDAISKLPPKNQLEIYNTIMSYCFLGKIPPDIKPVSSSVFELIKPNIDNNLARSEKAKNAGKASGQKRNSNGTKSELNDNSHQTTDEQNGNLTLTKTEQNGNSTQPNKIINNKIINIEKSNIINDITKKEDKVTTAELILSEAKPPTKTKEEKKQDFKKLLLDPKLGYVEKYGTDMLADFYSYWTESSPNSKLLRWEMQKVFDISRRLATWAKNNKSKSNYNFENGNNQSSYQTAGERGRNAHAQALANVLTKYGSNGEIFG